MRKDFELTKEQMERLLKCSEPVPYIIVGGVGPISPQDRANTVWAALGQEMGFKSLTVKPGKDDYHFSAEEV